MELDKFEEFLTQGNMAKNTISAYLYAVKEFGSRHKELNKRNLLVYKTYLIETYKPKTVNLRIQALNKYLVFVGKTKLRLKSVKVQQRSYLENVISNADYTFLKNKLKKEDNLEWYFVVRFLATTGARVSELVQIKIEHVQVGYYDIYTKGGKIRRIYIPKTLHGNRKVVTDTQPYKWLSLSQSLWRAYYYKRYITAAEELCGEVWLKRESGLPSLIPPSLCQEFLGEVQRHCPACRPYGA